MDVLIGNVPVTEISTLDPGKISTTADTEILGWTKLKKKKRKRKLWMDTDDFSNRHYYPHHNHYY